MEGPLLRRRGGAREAEDRPRRARQVLDALDGDVQIPGQQRDLEGAGRDAPAALDGAGAAGAVDRVAQVGVEPGLAADALDVGADVAGAEGDDAGQRGDGERDGDGAAGREAVE